MAPLRIGPFELGTPVVLAPMAGITNRAFRRLCRAWRVADARAAGNVWRLKSARGMLRCGLDHNGGHAVSNVRGISEWIPPAVSEAFLLNLAERGYSVIC